MTPTRTNGTPEGHAVCSASCPRCGVHVLGGIDPGFTLPMAAMLIPCSLRALRSHLSRAKPDYPGRFRRQGSRHHWVRILYASEVLRIRASLFRGAIDTPKPSVVQEISG